MLILGLGPAVPARAALNGAGLVVRHGDGRLVVAYVEFAEPRISGVELLRRAGVRTVLAPAGYGEAVCAINGEGCRADDCFCKSYGNPSFYWRYYQPRDGRWAYASRGPSERQVGDGEIDGWEWASGGTQLPLLTIDEIAARAGVRRSASAPTATPMPPSPTPLAPVVTPSATPRADPSPSPRPATRVAPVAATAAPAPTGAPPPTATPASATRPPVAATVGPSPSPPPSATVTLAAVSRIDSTATPAPAPAVALATMTPTPVHAVALATASPAPVAPATGVPTTATAAVVAAVAATPQARAVITASDGATAPLPAAEAPSVPWLGYGLALLAALALAGYLIWAARRRRGDADAPDQS